MTRKTKKVVWIVAVLAITSAVIFGLIFFGAFSPKVSVTVGGKPYATLSLKKQIFNINGTNTIVVSRMGVRMIESNCPDKNCMAQGEITSSLIPLVCAYNKVCVEILEKRNHMDAISY